MRSALALSLLVLLPVLLPLGAAEEPLSAGFADERGCHVARNVAGALVRLDGCALRQEGAVTLVGCEEGACTLDVDVIAAATGLPPGARAIEAWTTTNFPAHGRVDLCRAEGVALEGETLSCEGAASITLAVPQACRLFTLSVRLTLEAAVSDGFETEFRLCPGEGTLERVN